MNINDIIKRDFREMEEAKKNAHEEEGDEICWEMSISLAAVLVLFAVLTVGIFYAGMKYQQHADEKADREAVEQFHKALERAAAEAAALPAEQLLANEPSGSTAK